MCDKSLQLIGYNSPNLHLPIQFDNDQIDLRGRIQGLTSSIQCLSENQRLPAFVQLLKIVVSLSINEYLSPQDDDTFQDLMEILQKVDPLDHFLLLITKYNLAWILERIVSMHTVATDTFAGKALLHAVDLGLHPLIQLLLKNKCPLDATEFRRTNAVGLVSLYYSAVFLAAAFQRDLGLVRTLLDAGASVKGTDISLLAGIIHEWRGTSISASDVEIFRAIMDAQVAQNVPDLKHEWTEAVETLLPYGEVSLCKNMLENMLCTVGKDNHEVCSALVNTATSKQISPLKSILAAKRHRISCLKQDWISQLILRGVTGIVILEPSDDVLELLLNQCPTILANLESDFAFIMGATRGACGDVSLLLHRHWHAYFNDYTKEVVLLRAVNGRWSKLVNELAISGIYLHRNSKEGCLISTSFYWGQIAVSNETRDFLLEESIRLSQEAVICLCTALSFSGHPLLLHRLIENYEGKWPAHNFPSLNKLLETPEVLLHVLGIEDSGILLRLINSGISFDALNQISADDVEKLLSDPPQRFSHKPEVLREAFSRGLLPCPAILIMCIFYCSEYCVANVKTVLDASITFGVPFSKAQLTICLNSVPKIHERIRFRDPAYGDVDYIYRCSDDCHKHHGSALRILVKFGGVFDSSWVQKTLENVSGHRDGIVWQILLIGNHQAHFAISRSDKPLLEELLYDGVIHDEYGSFLYTSRGPADPLQYAAMCGNWEALEFLLQNGADVNAPPHARMGSTALQMVAANGDVNMAQYLLGLGADINGPAADKLGLTALERAVSRGRLDMVHLLINNNTNLLELRKDCKRASRLARYFDHSAMANLLEKHARQLAERLGIDHEDYIDNLCICELCRHGPDEDCDRCERGEKYSRKKDSASIPPCCIIPIYSS